MRRVRRHDARRPEPAARRAARALQRPGDLQRGARPRLHRRRRVGRPRRACASCSRTSARFRGEHGYFTETFCVQSRFFQPHNGMRVDAIRNEIERLDALAGRARAPAHEPHGGGRPRRLAPAGCRWPTSSSGRRARSTTSSCASRRGAPGPAGTVSRLDAGDLAAQLDGFDCAYLDPPYNQHSYFSNYHVWETLMRWDAPEHYGVACKRVDCRTTKSPYNSKRGAWQAFSSLIERLPTPWIVVSFNNEGFHDLDQVAALLSREGLPALRRDRLQALRRRPDRRLQPERASASARSRTCATRSCCSSSARTRRRSTRLPWPCERPASARWGGAQATGRPARGADRQRHGTRCLEGHHALGPQRVHLLGRGCQAGRRPESAAFAGPRRSWRKASAGPAAGRGASTASAPAANREKVETAGIEPASAIASMWLLRA